MEEPLFYRVLANEMSHAALKEACRGKRLSVSGTKEEMALRLATATGPGGRPSRPQLVYLAAASRRQSLVLPWEAMTASDAASAWLSRYGDWRGSAGFGGHR